MCIRHFAYLETEKTDFCHSQLHLPYHKTGNIGIIHYYSNISSKLIAILTVNIKTISIDHI